MIQPRQWLLIFALLAKTYTQDVPEYAAHMAKLANLSAKQAATFIIRSWPLPGNIDSNPSVANWTSKGDLLSDNVIVTNCNRVSCYYTVMKFDQNCPWTVTDKTDVIIAVNHTDGFRARLIVEDIRVFTFNSEPKVVYNIHPKGHRKQFYYAALHRDQISGSVYVDNRTEITIEHEVGRRDQKNWTPFTYSQRATSNSGPAYSVLLFIYSVYPHRIVHVNETIYAGLMKAYTVSSTKAMPPSPNTVLDASSSTHASTDGRALDVSSVWSWGEPRGGTQAELIDTPYGRKYLTFFHSSGRFAVRYLQTYYMGAYLFDPEPPFAMSHISTEPIAPNEFYNESFGGWAYKRRLDYIIFPMGYVIRGDTIYVTCGKNDRAGWVVSLNKTALLTSLKPLESVTIVDRFHEHFNNTLHQTGSAVGNSGTDLLFHFARGAS